MILAVVASIIASTVSRKKQEQAKRAAQADQAARVRQAENMRARVGSSSKAARPAGSVMQPTVRPNPVAPSVYTPQYSGSMAYNSSEGMSGSSTEGTSLGSSEGMYGTQGGNERNYDKPRHIVTPSRETGHAHAETSITGVSDCPPDAQPLEFEHEDAYSHERRAGEGFKLDISKNAVLQGVIFSEVLGKPRALKRYSRA